MAIDFSKIRIHDGSQHNGFEELVCQLAHLQKPESAKVFVRKEGSGGDAGVECYWILEDDSEVCWQAKYFLQKMDGSRWSQIDESVRTAINRHQNLTKYIVCLPLDRTDSRKIGRGGRQVVSIQDEWNRYVDRWKRLANDNDRDIEFEYWGKHELTLFLSSDDPKYSGRALYWFNDLILGMNVFKKVINRSRDTLGDRYTPEFHIDLPVVKNFDGLCLNGEWWSRLNIKMLDVVEKGERFFQQSEKEEEQEVLDNDKISELQTYYTNLKNYLSEGIEYKNFDNNLDQARDCLGLMLENYNKIISDDRKDDYRKGKYNDLRYGYNEFYSACRTINDFFHEKGTISSEKKAAMLFGEAGIGKSHLLCDLSLYRAKNNQPTLFLLGQHYEGGNPLKTIKISLDLEGYRDGEVLGALDAAGEAYQSRTLIVIDALNEGTHRGDWVKYIKAMLYELSQYDNICVLVSCRTTYIQYILAGEADDTTLVRIKHDGFQGYEHRAAEKYLSRQGISKPSAPILAPEFTNPLFLKVCCEALKSKGMTTFPKGLHGITSLFEFYVGNVEDSIAREKQYNPNERIIITMLESFALELFPNHLSGMSMTEARQYINGYDPNPNIGSSLFNDLLDIGIISEDISYETSTAIPVIRFTYERHSDQFIANKITSTYSIDNIDELFSENTDIGRIVAGNKYWGIAGILEALAIIVPEKFGKELIDLLPDTYMDNDFLLSELFANSAVWRSPSSFTEKTLELLNILRVNSQERSLDILLKLSTEPDHPWNAELLHKSLKNKFISERDNFWSIHIALGDEEEDEGSSETIIRTLIEWACFGELCNIENERARLCAIVLLWFLTTSNRKIRDQSTKSLVRLLSNFPHLVVPLIEEFHYIDDLYLVERLYAVAFGVVRNINDDDAIAEIANAVFMQVFKDGNPIPHILLRDYARCVMEYALFKKLLHKNIDPELFRPPYASAWPIDNPTEEEIDEIIGDEEFSNIKESLMGFPGDFGNYTMSCIHDWSPTLLSEPKPKTGYEYKVEFAENHLNGKIKDQYLEKIKPIEIEKSFDIDDFLERISIVTDENETADEREKQKSEEDDFRAKLENSLNLEQKEHFRWVYGVSGDRAAEFSRRWAQRWVCKRVYEFGWTEELFSGFEKYCSFGRGGGVYAEHMERIGKKYQWIALHELLARLSDNVHWIGSGYGDIRDERYLGPWQMNLRDIDPTIWLRRNGDADSYYNKTVTWWQKHNFTFEGINTLEKQEEYLWSEDILPNFSNLLTVNKPEDNSNWLVLSGFWKQKQGQSVDKSNPRLDCWFRISSIVVPKGSFQSIKQSIGTHSLTDPHIVNVPTEYSIYLGEYPWHPSRVSMHGWSEPGDGFRSHIPVKYLVPVSKYYWENGNEDYSIDHSLSFYMPAGDLVNSMGLTHLEKSFGTWVDSNNKVTFFDPSNEELGASYALIKKDSFLKWLNDNELEIIWLIGGEKSLFGSGIATKFFGKNAYSGLYQLENGIPMGEIWFTRHEARN